MLTISEEKEKVTRKMHLLRLLWRANLSQKIL